MGIEATSHTWVTRTKSKDKVVIDDEPVSTKRKEEEEYIGVQKKKDREVEEPLNKELESNSNQAKPKKPAKIRDAKLKTAQVKKPSCLNICF